MKNNIVLALTLLFSGLGGALSPRQQVARDHEVDNVLRRAQCHADDCARVVSGTARGTAVANSHRDDCASFLVTTVSEEVINTVYVTPTVVSVFLTTTVSVGPEIHSTATFTTEYEDYGKRRRDNRSPSTATITPTNVPKYASACDATRYRSACSCWGVNSFVYTEAYSVGVTTITAPPYTETLVNTIQSPDFSHRLTTTVGYTETEAIPCGQSVSPGAGRKTYDIHCDSVHAGPGSPYGVIPDVHDYDGCLASCNVEYYCNGFEFDIPAAKCTIYQSNLVEYPISVKQGTVFGFVARRN